MMTAVAPVVSSLRFVPHTFAADDSATLSRLVQAINSDVPADREEAALKLVNRGTPEAGDAVLNALRNANNPNAQIAVATALSQVSDPDTRLIPAIGELLGSNQALTEAAAQALTAYRDNPDAFNRLKNFADIAITNNTIRTSVIHAIGALTDPPAAEYLINLSVQTNQNPAIQRAAMEALGEMTGLTNYGTDVRKWQQWWAGVRGKNADQFRAMLLETRSRPAAQARQKEAQLVASMTAELILDYYLIPDDKKNETLLRYLKNSAPDIRSVGVALIHETYAKRPPTDATLKRIYEMISDADENVRFNVADLLIVLPKQPTMNPVSALTAQLAIEKVPRVKKEIAQALGKLGEAAAAPALLNLLHDPQKDVAIAGANAFASLGDALHRTNPADANKVSAELRQLLKDLQNQRGFDDVRAADMFALAALRDSLSSSTFRDAFGPGESDEVRRAALTGLGLLGDTNADEIVADQLLDPNARIRLAAAIALQSVATPGQDERIFQQMRNESSSDVGQALWLAFTKLLDNEPSDKIRHWVPQFGKEPDRKLVVQQKLDRALRRSNDAEAIAYNEQDLAATMLEVKPPRVGDAVANLSMALDYWRGPGKANGGTIERLIVQLLEAKLNAGLYADAADFAAKQLPFDPYYQKICGPRIKDKIDSLIKENKLTDAQTLIDAAFKMQPPLDDKYLTDIKLSQAELKQRGGNQ